MDIERPVAECTLTGLHADRSELSNIYNKNTGVHIIHIHANMAFRKIIAMRDVRTDPASSTSTQLVTVMNTTEITRE